MSHNLFALIEASDSIIIEGSLMDKREKIVIKLPLGYLENLGSNLDLKGTDVDDLLEPDEFLEVEEGKTPEEVMRQKMIEVVVWKLDSTIDGYTVYFGDQQHLSIDSCGAVEDEIYDIDPSVESENTLDSVQFIKGRPVTEDDLL